MKLRKYHGLGNDYLIYDPAVNEIELNDARIRLICDRNYGIGADGILFGPLFIDGNIWVKIYNPDGSEAEKSGNGVRIFARYLHDAGYVGRKAQADKSIYLQTAGGEVQAEYLEDGEIRVMMGRFTCLSSRIPVAGEVREVVDEKIRIGATDYLMTCVSMGNPHCVLELNHVSKELALQLGPQIENHSLFPNRINMQLLKVLDRNNIQIEIYERGAGYTLASGSSSCAAACAAYKKGLTDRNINVHMPGGILKILITEEDTVYMTGRVSQVYSCEPDEEFVQELIRIH